MKMKLNDLIKDVEEWIEEADDLLDGASLYSLL